MNLSFSLITQMEKDVECRNAVCIFCISCRTKFVLKVFVHLSALTSRGIHGVTWTAEKLFLTMQLDEHPIQPRLDTPIRHVANNTEKLKLDFSFITQMERDVEWIIFCFKAHDQWHDHPIHPRLDIPINATYISPSALGSGISGSSLKCLQNIWENLVLR